MGKTARYPELNSRFLRMMKERFPRRVRLGKDGKYRVRHKDRIGVVHTFMTLELRESGWPLVTVDLPYPNTRAVGWDEAFGHALDMAEEMIATHERSWERWCAFCRRQRLLKRGMV
jgi:hypothetical protein